MSLWDDDQLKIYNERKLHKMREDLEILREKAKESEIKKPIINNGYRICPCEYYCLRDSE